MGFGVIASSEGSWSPWWGWVFGWLGHGWAPSPGRPPAVVDRRRPHPGLVLEGAEPPHHIGGLLRRAGGRHRGAGRCGLLGAEDHGPPAPRGRGPPRRPAPAGRHGAVELPRRRLGPPRPAGGAAGPGRRQLDSIDALNTVSALGGVVLASAVAVFIVLLLRAARSRELPGDDPWSGHSLEWTTSSPPPVGNFASLLPITSEAPLYDARHRPGGERLMATTAVSPLVTAPPAPARRPRVLFTGAAFGAVASALSSSARSPSTCSCGPTSSPAAPRPCPTTSSSPSPPAAWACSRWPCRW